MKKTLLLLLALSAAGLQAQNFQLHYDFRGDENPILDRGYATATLEMFRPDDYGATFWFVDMDFDDPVRGMSLAYWEIARYLSLGKESRWSVTLQYNDGAATFGSLDQVWLGGVSYLLILGDWYIPVDLLYRGVRGADGPDVQFTAVWDRTVWDDRLQIAGYLDVWTQDPLVRQDREMELAVQAEPQLWWHLWEQLWVGGEVEISRYFLPAEGWQCYPTLGMKWDFDG